jgi:LCP family protein required for cell wall assembly
VSKSRPTRLSAHEKTILGLVIAASLVVWGVLIAATTSAQNQPLTAQDVVPSPVAQRASPTATHTLVPAPSPTSTPAPVQPTVAATATPLPTQPSGPPPLVGDKTTVIAMLGMDEPRNSKIWRTDTIVLVLINEDNQRIGVLSIPRDLWVFVPGHGHARINTVDALGERTDHPGGGPGLLDQTLRYNLDIPIDHYVRIDFRGFEDLIDELGGVTVDVKAPITDRFPYPLHPSGWARITLPAGPKHMDGRTTLSYCRSRMTTSDFDRSRRQQQVIVALAAKMLTLETLVRAPKLWNAYHTTVDTDLGMVKTVRLAYIAQGIGLENVQTRRLGLDTTTDWVTPGGAQVLLPQRDRIQAAVRELLSPPE